MASSIKFRNFNLIWVIIILVINGCSDNSDQNDNTPDPIVNGGDAYLYEAIMIETQNIDLKEDEYEATFGKNVIRIIKVDENKLGFIVPADAELGNTDLDIKTLNLKIHYNVLKPLLSETPDDIISQFTTIGDSYIASQEEVDPFINYEKFKDFYANNASSEQKQEMALFYYVNKDVFDAAIQFDPDNEGKLSSSDIALMKRFGLVVVATGGIILLTSVSLTTPQLIVTAAATGFAIYKLKKYGDQAVNEHDIVTIDVKLGIQRKNEDGILLTNNVPKQLPFQLQARALTQADAGTTNETVSDFFDKLSFGNNLISKINTAIVWINNNLSLINLTTYDLILLQTNPATSNFDVTSEAMQKISLSIDHPNLELIDASLIQDGQLNLKVNIIGEPNELPVNSKLFYTYNDGLSNLTGYFDISVSSNDSNNKTLTYSINAGGSIYNGSENLPFWGVGGLGQPVWANSIGNFHLFDDYFDVYIILVQDNPPVYIQIEDVPISSSGEYQLFGYGEVSESSPWLAYIVPGNGDDITTYNGIGSISKTNVTSFSFTGTYQSQYTQTPISISSTITIE